ncbi:autotransporter assembly complex protein TamA [Actibacterium sp. XHP0104]|uniref:autotransporter assembly complex protein TamA n=1 Tax=Actibacterium sp. XHP0104 TaxID=2984335 RepID=UPI0021E809EF|nr:autotransporter assembly complex family protein [Actibacterium sp. XHP0104]MCV2881995.1 autotransporter assembly complex protein TamA [Actibacterium sp. XHP0104]
MRLSTLFLAVMLGVSGAQAAELSLKLTGEAPEGLHEELRAASLTFSANADAASTTQDLIAAARADYARLVGVLYGRAYYGPVIHIRIDGAEAAALPPFDGPHKVREIVITVDPGQRFVFSRAEMAPLPKRVDLPEGFAAGQPAEADVIKAAAVAGVDGWRSAGHAKAALAGQRLLADHRKATLAADLTLAPGPRVQFGDLVLHGESRVRDDRLHRIAGLPVGTIFDPHELDRVANRLRRTGAFRSVVLTESDQINPDGSMDIGLTVTDERPRRIGVGAEISSQEGVGLSAHWMHRNFFGGAERLRFDAEIGGIGGQSGGEDYLLGASLTRPAAFGPDTSLRFAIAAQRLDEPDYIEEKLTAEAALRFHHIENLEWGVGVGLRHSEVWDDLGARNFDLLLFPVVATWERRNSTLNADDGFFINAEATPFLGLRGSASGARFYIDGRAYESFGADERLTAAARVQLGSALGVGLSEIPPEMLFYSGGGGTVRGQPYQSLGVDLGGGDSTGGRSFLGLSTELRYDVTDDWGVVGFADAGFVGRKALGGDGDWHSGAGLGLRYNTGIGPIRLDVAVPVSGSTSDGMQFYVGIGQAF